MLRVTFALPMRVSGGRAVTDLSGKANPELALAFHIAGHGDARGFDLDICDPGSLEGLKSEFPEVDLEIARGVPGAAATLGFAGISRV